MARSTRGDKERSREQELKYENSKLKKQISSLRRQLARVDLDRHSYVKEMVEEHLAQEDRHMTTSDMLESMKNTWKCNSCKEGHLEIHIYTRMAEDFYFRQCSNCDYRTKSQLYTKEVRGIIKEAPPEPEKRSFKPK